MKLLRIYASDNQNITAYHGSDDPNLTTSKIDVTSYRSEPGFHCGTKQQALTCIKNLYSGSGYLYEVRINARNMLHVSEDLSEDWYRFQSYANYAINPNNAMLSAAERNPRPAEVLQTLRDCGYACVSYPNDKAFEGEGTSYMIIDKSCISSMKLAGEVENNVIKENKQMKRVIESSLQNEERSSNYLISCIQDGTIEMETVFAEILKYLSEDDIKEVNEELGLYDLYSTRQNCRNCLPIKAASDDRFQQMKEEIREEREDGIDPLYEETAAGKYVAKLAANIEDELNIFSEFSMRYGSGVVWIYDGDTEDELASHIDYNEFNDRLLDCVEESDNEVEAMDKMRKYYKSLIS